MLRHFASRHFGPKSLEVIQGGLATPVNAGGGLPKRKIPTRTVYITKPELKVKPKQPLLVEAELLDVSVKAKEIYCSANYQGMTIETIGLTVRFAKVKTETIQISASFREAA